MGLPAAEGLFVFLVLVLFRKRVLKGLAKPNRIWFFNVVPDRWRDIKDSERTDESSDISDQGISLEDLQRPESEQNLKNNSIP